ncbi:hypothetical protein V2J09_003828 [Rumex salicifolius]
MNSFPCISVSQVFLSNPSNQFLPPTIPIPITLGAKTNSVSACATSTSTSTSSSCSPHGSVRAPPARKRLFRRHATEAAVLDIRKSPNLLDALARSGGILKPQDLNLILREFGRLKRYTELIQLFEWMEEHGKVNISTYSSYIKFTGESLNPTKALEVYNRITDKSVRNHTSVCNSVLSCLIKNRKFDSASSLFHQMKQNGLQPDVVTYSTLLAGCIKNMDGYSKAMQLVNELESSGLQMDDVTYGTLIAIFAANGQCKQAEECFIRMKSEGHIPNVYHYSSLLNAFSADGNYQKADELVNDMKSAGLVPNKVILTTLLKVYARAGLFEKSRQLLLELEASGYAGDEIPYCLLMDAFSKSGKIDEAKLVLDEMHKRRIKSDGYAYSIMISAFCRSGHLEKAKQLAKDYESMHGKFDVVISNTILCAYCRVGDMESVMQILRKMDALAISPDKNTFGILIKYFCKEKLYPLAYRTMEDMHSKGHQPSEETCTFLMINLAKMGAHKEAYSVYNILRYSRRTICKALHEKILRILIAGQLLKEAYVVVKDNAKCISQPAMKKFLTTFMRSGNINLINDVVKVTSASGCKIDQEIFQLAVSRYIAQPEKKDLLLQFLKWMQNHGYMVDSATRTLILKNSHHQLIEEMLSTHGLAQSKRTR